MTLDQAPVASICLFQELLPRRGPRLNKAWAKLELVYFPFAALAYPRLGPFLWSFVI